ncbi:LAFA_0D13696g1_1 [Lachancea sp. 'fantastica']|nr:LAFA_0D13696g1_1 [Lachancea sp. 'fantastica']
MSKLGLATEVQKLPIPDLRFQQTFQNSLKREAEKNKKVGTQEANGEGVINAAVVCKVVLRDVLILPFVQGILWTTVLIALKPWLRYVNLKGQACGRAIYNMVLGKNLIPKK